MLDGRSEQLPSHPPPSVDALLRGGSGSRRAEAAAWVSLGRPERSAAWAAADAGDRPAKVAEARLAALSAAVGALRRVLAAVADRLLATKAPDRLCYARLADYARERPGVSVRQLQELARVHRALAGLPALERALVANELPWSKVRLVAGVATAENEAAWVARARVVSTRQLEHEVRAHRQREGTVDDAPSGAEETPPETRVEVCCTPSDRERWAATHEVAERVAGQRLSSGEALEWVVAEALSELSVDPVSLEPNDVPPAPPAEDDPPADAERAPGARASGRPLPDEVAALAAGLDAADAFELDRRLCAAVRLEQTLDAAMAPLLRIVRCAEYEWCGAWQPLAAYARNELGISVSKARALVRLERAGDVCPALREAYRSGRLSWVKAECLLPLLLLDVEGAWRPVWVAWAGRVTMRRLRADVARALLLRAGHGPAWRRCLFHPERAQDPIPPGERQMCAPDVDPEATERLTWRVPGEVAALFAAVRETLRGRLSAPAGRRATDGEVFRALLDRAVAAWTLRDPRARRPDPVVERDGYACAVPGCTSRRNLHDHHIRFRSAGGPDAPANRITLCAFHHQRCLHAGWLRVRGDAPDGLVFELGVRPDAPPLARYRSGDIALPQA